MEQTNLRTQVIKKHTSERSVQYNANTHVMWAWQKLQKIRKKTETLQVMKLTISTSKDARTLFTNVCVCVCVCVCACMHVCACACTWWNVHIIGLTRWGAINNLLLFIYKMRSGICYGALFCLQWSIVTHRHNPHQHNDNHSRLSAYSTNYMYTFY